MSAPYGASPATWLHWRALGLETDLLPVVCESGLTLSPTSTLGTYGKVPSRFDSQGRVVGFPKWTTYTASAQDVVAWSKDNRLGICLQTRHARAIDVDVEDMELADEIRRVLDQWASDQALRFLYRVRYNSTKFLTLFHLEGDYPKQILRLPGGGLIEFLGNGQQCVVAGTHPSGARYEWEGGLPAELPVLTLEQFGELKAVLQKAFGGQWSVGRIRKARVAGESSGVEDPMVDFLKKNGWVRT